jgi:hypothetical protein
MQPSYTPFSVSMDMHRIGDVTFTIWGKDRKDVMVFAKTHYRKQLRRVTSVTSKQRTHDGATSGGNDERTNPE